MHFKDIVETLDTGSNQIMKVRDIFRLYDKIIDIDRDDIINKIIVSENKLYYIYDIDNQYNNIIRTHHGKTEIIGKSEIRKEQFRLVDDYTVIVKGIKDSDVSFEVVNVDECNNDIAELIKLRISENIFGVTNQVLNVLIKEYNRITSSKLRLSRNIGTTHCDINKTKIFNGLVCIDDESTDRVISLNGFYRMLVEYMEYIRSCEYMRLATSLDDWLNKNKNNIKGIKMAESKSLQLSEYILKRMFDIAIIND